MQKSNLCIIRKKQVRAYLAKTIANRIDRPAGAINNNQRTHPRPTLLRDVVHAIQKPIVFAALACALLKSISRSK